ncbi:PAS domain S-box protein [Mariprofundus erugo]|uniref:ATP-binding protein n=1 Tax=Mariprofundus erugo TaxID=2528639 RepID=UPI0010FD9082|nr:ATP-binding protein [Mariprofundus erugo]TLS74546.1 PAS domain S-box protein [Mariprofundus erugo]
MFFSTPRPVLLAGVLGLLITAVMSGLSYNRLINDERHTFDNQVQNIREDLSIQSRKAIEALDNISSLFKASESVDIDEFHILASEQVERYPFIRTIYYAPYVLHSERSDVENAMHELGFIGFTIHAADDSTAGSFPIKYIEPFSPLYILRLGYDLLLTPSFTNAVNRAVDTAAITSAKSDITSKQSITLFKALYAGRLSLQERAIYPAMKNGMLALDIDPQILLQEVDRIPQLSVTLLYRNQPLTDKNATTSTAPELVHFDKQVTIGKEGLQLSLYFDKSVSWHQADLTLLLLSSGMGITITILLIVIARTFHSRSRLLLQRNEEVQALVDEKTKELQKLSSAVEYAGEAITLMDASGIIEYINPAFTRIMGYQPEHIVGQNAIMLGLSEQGSENFDEIWQTVVAGESWTGRQMSRHQDGTLIPTRLSMAPIHNSNSQLVHVVAIHQDLSEQEVIEERLRQSQKMEAVGTLVGGIAHDFNNMLAAIQGNVYLADINMDHPATVREKLGKIETLTSRASTMVQQLLSFARKDRVKLSSLSLNSMLKESFKLSETVVPENIDLVYDICEEELIVKADVTQLQQIIMNLLSNACDALKQADKPNITCRLSADDMEPSFMQAHPELKSSRVAHLSVADNGSGIAKSDLDKIFEPFFTTKDVGEGTGLGLSMVFGAIQRIQGAITVESTRHKGTTFHLYLPRIEQAAVISANDEQSDIIVQGMGETVLLVDDAHDVRDAISEVLSGIGYRVLTASDGKDALHQFSMHEQDIKAVISDVVMPHMGGKELFRLLRQRNPRLPFLMITGYDSLKAAGISADGDDCVLINKPFSVSSLSRQLHDMIHHTQPTDSSHSTGNQ